MEAEVFRAAEGMQYARNDMLARVTLHPLKPKRKIELAMQRFAHAGRAVQKMKNTAFPLLHVEHLKTAERSRIRALTAALGEKRRGIGFYEKSVFVLGNGENPRIEGGKIRVPII
jgi:hypothetical protein